MSSTKLKPEINLKGRKDGVLLQKIADSSGKHFGTVSRWFYNNSPNLTRIEILEIIAAHFSLEMENILDVQNLN